MRLGLSQGLSTGGFVPSAPFTNAFSATFDGTNDYADLGASDDIITSDIFSLSMWFKLGDTAGAATRPFVSNADAGGTNLRVVVETSGLINMGYYNGSGFSYTTGGSAVDDNNWHHMVFTTTASAQVLYIDGTSVATTSNTFSNRASSSVSTTVAAHVASGVYADMHADEVATWAGTALTAGNVTEIYNSGGPSDISTLSPTGWWRMGDSDGGTGTTATDQGSGGNDATLTGGAAFNSSIPPDFSRKSVSFDGSNDHALTAADDTLADKTYSWWAKSLNTSKSGVFSHGASGRGAFYFNYTSGKPTLHLHYRNIFGICRNRLL